MGLQSYTVLWPDFSYILSKLHSVPLQQGSSALVVNVIPGPSGPSSRRRLDRRRLDRRRSDPSRRSDPRRSDREKEAMGTSENGRGARLPGGPGGPTRSVARGIFFSNSFRSPGGGILKEGIALHVKRQASDVQTYSYSIFFATV